MSDIKYLYLGSASYISTICRYNKHSTKYQDKQAPPVSLNLGTLYEMEWVTNYILLQLHKSHL